jgi:hypothetical protein
MSGRPDDGGSKDLWDVGKLLPDYTALQPRRQPSSYSPLWEPQILPENTLLNTKLVNRALSTRHLSLVLSTNMMNLTARNLKSSDEHMSITQVCHFTQLCRFMLVYPIWVPSIRKTLAKCYKICSNICCIFSLLLSQASFYGIIS